VDRRHRRGAARGQDDRAARLEPLVAGAHRALAVEHRGAAHERHVALVEPRELARIVEVMDHLVAAGQRGGRVELAAGRLRGARDAPCLGERLAGPQERLGGHARPVGALAADQLALDEGDVQPALAQAPGGDLAGRPGAHHDDVEAPGRGHGGAVSHAAA
jgi:hypothetical protein